MKIEEFEEYILVKLTWEDCAMSGGYDRAHSFFRYVFSEIPEAERWPRCRVSFRINKIRKWMEFYTLHKHRQRIEEFRDACEFRQQ